MCQNSERVHSRNTHRLSIDYDSLSNEELHESESEGILHVDYNKELNLIKMDNYEMYKLDLNPHHQNVSQERCKSDRQLNKTLDFDQKRQEVLKRKEMIEKQRKDKIERKIKEKEERFKYV